MKRIFTAARSLAPRVIVASLAEAACSGLAGPLGAVVEVGAGLCADSAVSASVRLTGPTIGGQKVTPIRVTSIEEVNARVTACKLSAETFDRYEHRLMDGMALARGDEPRRALEHVDNFHIVDVSDPNYRKWIFTEGGNPSPLDTPPDLRVAGIPVPIMRDFASQSYMHAKLYGEIIYEHVLRSYAGQKVAYRRLIHPVTDAAGMVVRLNVLAIIEQESNDFIAGGMG